MMNTPVDIFDAFSKFSVNSYIRQDKDKYVDKMAWVNELQTAL